jgi:opacity protein-like surface antigen
MRLSFHIRVALFVVLTSIATSGLVEAQGIKFGPTFAKFGSEALDFKTRTGLHGGLFFGGNRSGVFGVQTEINWIRKNSAAELSSEDIRIDYVQVPVLLRLNIGTDSANGFAVYGIAGPAISLKIADEVNGITVDDGFEGADVGLVFGGGVEITRFIIEGRYEKGLRRINDTFFEFTEIKSESFTILFGIRFK